VDLAKICLTRFKIYGNPVWTWFAHKGVVLRSAGAQPCCSLIPIDPVGMVLLIMRTGLPQIDLPRFTGVLLRICGLHCYWARWSSFYASKFKCGWKMIDAGIRLRNLHMIEISLFVNVTEYSTGLW